MTEDDAKSWLRQRWGQAALDRLQIFADGLVQENARQNLIAAATIPTLWARHIVDSVQLLDLAGDRSGLWVDIGTGGGPPGLVVGLLRDDPVCLVEPRRQRAEFLQRIAQDAGRPSITVAQKKVEAARTSSPVAIVSARAVASPRDLLDSAAHLITPATLVILPRGRDAAVRVADLKERWHGVFHVKQSVTHEQSGIIVASGLKRR